MFGCKRVGNLNGCFGFAHPNIFLSTLLAPSATPAASWRNTFHWNFVDATFFLCYIGKLSGRYNFLSWKKAVFGGSLYCVGSAWNVIIPSQGVWTQKVDEQRIGKKIIILILYYVFYKDIIIHPLLLLCWKLTTPKRKIEVSLTFY